MHIQDPEQKRWIQQHVEGRPSTLNEEEQRHILDRLNAAEAFERFLHTRYVGQKRFGLEGAESTIVLLDALLDSAAGAGVAEVVMGMSHRGRLNVLANIVGKSYEEIFEEFEGTSTPIPCRARGREVPQGCTWRLQGQRRRTPSCHPRLQPFSSRSRRPRRRGHDPRQAGPASPPTDGTPKALAEEPSAFRACRSWSTATPRSPARAWSPRR